VAAFVTAALIAGGVAGGVAVGFGATFAIAGSVFLGGFLPAFGTALVMGGISKAMQKNPQRPESSFQSAGRTVSIRQPVAPRQVVFGMVRTGGTVTYICVNDGGIPTVGPTSLWHMVITLAGHPCRGMTRVYADDRQVEFDATGLSIGHFANVLRIRRDLGTSGAQPFADLVTETAVSGESAWRNDTDRQDFCTKAYLRLVANRELFPNGLPNLTVEVAGVATVYDPRTDAEGWTDNPALLLAHFITEDTFYGLQADYDEEIDEDDLIAAAGVCDEMVLLKAGQSDTFTAAASTDIITRGGSVRPGLTGDGVRVSSTGTLPAGLAADTTYYLMRAEAGLQLATSLANARAGTAIDITDAGSGTHTLTYYSEPRYRANGAFLTTENPKDVMQRLLAAMAGTCINLGGKWHIHAGAYSAPTITLDEDDLDGESTVQAHVSGAEHANGVRGVFTDVNALWQPNDFPAIDGAAYLEEDGGERVWKDIDLTAFVTSVSQAQRLAKIDLLKLRQSLTETTVFKLTAFGAVAGRTVARTDAQMGWSAKAFDVMESGFAVVEGDGEDQGPRLQVPMMLRETAAAVYDWTSSADEQLLDLAPNTNLPSIGDVDVPGVPYKVGEELLTKDDRSVVTKVTIGFMQSLYPFSPAYLLEYKPVASSSYTPLPIIQAPTSSADPVEVELQDIAPGRYNFRVLAIAPIGARSEYSTSGTIEIVGLTAEPADVSGFYVTVHEGRARCHLGLATDKDVQIGGRVWIRWSPLTSGAVWNDGSLIKMEGYPGDSIVCEGPLYAGTYMAKFEDSTGHFSRTEASFVVTETLLTGWTTLDTVTYDATFTGTKVNTVVVDGALQLAASTLWDSMPGTMDTWGLVDYLGGIETSGSCTYTTKQDLGSVQTVRLFPTFKTLGFDTGDTWDSRTDLMDDWGLVDGGSVEDAEILPQVRITQDDPNGASPTWGPWHNLEVADYTARGFEYRTVHTSGNVAHNRKLLQFRVAAKQPA
jgi:hypothetical protein